MIQCHHIMRTKDDRLILHCEEEDGHRPFDWNRGDKVQHSGWVDGKHHTWWDDDQETLRASGSPWGVITTDNDGLSAIGQLTAFDLDKYVEYDDGGTSVIRGKITGVSHWWDTSITPKTKRTCVTLVMGKETSTLEGDGNLVRVRMTSPVWKPNAKT